MVTISSIVNILAAYFFWFPLHVPLGHIICSCSVVAPPERQYFRCRPRLPGLNVCQSWRRSCPKTWQTKRRRSRSSCRPAEKNGRSPAMMIQSRQSCCLRPSKILLQSGFDFFICIFVFHCASKAFLYTFYHSYHALTASDIG